MQWAQVFGEFIQQFGRSTCVKLMFWRNLKVQSLMRYRTSYKDDWEVIFHDFTVFCFPCISQCIGCNWHALMLISQKHSHSLSVQRVMYTLIVTIKQDARRFCKSLSRVRELIQRWEGTQRPHLVTSFMAVGKQAAGSSNESYSLSFPAIRSRNLVLKYIAQY